MPDRVLTGPLQIDGDLAGELALRDGEIYRDENQIYPIAGDRYYVPVSGFTIATTMSAAYLITDVLPHRSRR